MKRVFTAVLLILVLTSCTPAPAGAPGIVPADYEQVQNKLEETQSQVDKLNRDILALQSSINDTQAKNKTEITAKQDQIDKLTGDFSSLQTKYNDLKTSYDTLLNKSPILRNPTWTDVVQFIRQDKTDTITYNLQTFDCNGFATLLRDRARNLGFRTAYIEIEFAGTAGHALNAFETTDNGLIYIDCTDGDKVAYVSSGQVYGTIVLDAVKPEYINCNGDPSQFWQALSYTKDSELFSYNYYVNYQKRREFEHKTLDAYNQAVNEFNQSKGNYKLTFAQINTWKDNVKALQQGLGAIYYEPMPAVNNIQTYWGE